ncbi:WhiB family transcriptional regulator [Acrocarpospora catenulata]|uniref:WhiB family transcriptional regulator n=1 Tax=Acrocarpospora catenulata TaxID=2836182 RepID=UPI0027E07C84|nr:WhiB family transcriptional regulator [Acrocarpospora catenulata]
MSAPRLAYVHPVVNLLDALTGELPEELADGAACGLDPELHTGPDLFGEESAEERAAREDVAKSVCAECPVRLRCLATALLIRPETGVWAGYPAEELARPLVRTYAVATVCLAHRDGVAS